MDYNKYALAVNKIFECLNQMKIGWDNPDNLNYISKIEEYQELVVEQSQVIQKAESSAPNPMKMEELG